VPRPKDIKHLQRLLNQRAPSCAPASVASGPGLKLAYVRLRKQGREAELTVTPPTTEAPRNARSIRASADPGGRRKAAEPGRLDDPC
jgi:hypothetical protein